MISQYGNPDANYICKLQHNIPWFASRTYSSNCNGMSLYLNMFLWTSVIAVSNGTSAMSQGFRKYMHTSLPMHVHQVMKNSLFHGLTAPYLIGMSQCFYIPYKHQSIYAASNGTSLMSIGDKVQEIWLHKVTYANQNHKIWLTSRANSSKSNGISPIMWGFSESIETDL